MSGRPCHACGSKGATPIAALNADAIDFAFLTAARYFFVSFSEPNSNAWLTAILGSESFFPDAAHAETMRRALAVVHEMRTSRTSMFHFSNPRCPSCSAIVTDDERHLLQMVQFARRGQNSRMASSAMLLCEGNDAERVLAAARDFAAIFAVKQPVHQQA
ncbi:MAG: hypothetical protein AAFX07_08425 [Pseudomonadota bacterium]